MTVLSPSVDIYFKPNSIQKPNSIHKPTAGARKNDYRHGAITRLNRNIQETGIFRNHICVA